MKMSILLKRAKNNTLQGIKIFDYLEFKFKFMPATLTPKQPQI